jgi:hypothetical protein
MSSESLAELFGSYRRLRDCLKIARPAVDSANLQLLNGTEFLGETKVEAAESLDRARQAVDDLVVAAMWAWFERYLIDYTMDRAGALESSNPTGFGRRLRERVTHEIEYWRLDDVLDLFKGLVDSSQIGIAKQIKDYRDWIAHRNPNCPPPAQTEPRGAYNLLLALINAVEEASTVTHS